MADLDTSTWHGPDPRRSNGADPGLSHKSLYLTTCVIPGCRLGIYKGQPVVRVRQWGTARVTGAAHPGCVQRSAA